MILIDCPGCGCPPRKPWKATFEEKWIVHCGDYNCIPKSEGKTAQEAIDNWNKEMAGR